MRVTGLLLLLACTLAARAQYYAEKPVAFKITGYMNPANDSTTIVQVLKPASVPLEIADRQMGALYHCYTAGTKLDTAMIGWGRCHLIKGAYYYFGLHLRKAQQATAGDLMYMKLKVPYVYDGLMLKIMNHAVSFTDVYGEPFMKENAVFTNTQKDELNTLDSMLKDIRFTGSAMLKQMPEQNQIIATGTYKGKKIFEAMQSAQRIDLESFIRYMIARPKNYAGNTWKISEIFATWMSEGAPAVISN